MNVAQAIIEAIARSDLGGPFVMNACHNRRTIRQHDGSWSKIGCINLGIVVAATIDLLMKLERGERRKRAVLIVQRSAVGIAEGTIGATMTADVAVSRTACSGEVAAAAAGRRAVALKCVAVRIVAVILGVVLAGRDQRTELEAIENRRFVPDRMVHAPIELSPVVSAGIAQ